MPGTTVTVQGEEKLRLKLGRVLEPIEKALAILAEYVHQKARIYAKPHPVDKGTLGNVIKVSFAGSGVAISAKVYEPRSVVGIALQVEEGRRPGKPPPVKAIKRWAVAHGIVTNYFLLARLIGKQGTKGIQFMARAAEDGERKAPEILKSAALKIEQNWGK